MKATLEFDLPEEREEFETACRADLYYSILHDIREILYRSDVGDEFTDALWAAMERMPDD